MFLQETPRPSDNETIEKTASHWFEIAGTPHELMNLVERWGGKDKDSITGNDGQTYKKSVLLGMIEGKADYPITVRAEMFPDIGDLRRAIKNIWPQAD